MNELRACYSGRVDALRDLLNRDSRIAFALVFGSTARGTLHPFSDMDVAVGLSAGVSLDTRETGALVSDLEQAAGRPIDLIFLHEAPPALAYRIFRDGVTLVERDHRAFVDRKARAVLEYLDFQPFENIAIKGALEAAARGR
jgi:predicted nucleotidyltransferase